MKVEFEDIDIEAIAKRVVELLRPYVARQDADDTIFDVKELARYLKVDESWVYKHVSLNSLPFFKAGKYTRFKKLAIDRWIESQKVLPVTPLSWPRKVR